MDAAIVIALAKAFLPHGYEARQRMTEGGRKLAYYTTAETALKILKNQEIWLRKASVLNDVSELVHGDGIVIAAWNSEKGTIFKAWAENIFPGSIAKIEALYNANSFSLRYNTYLLSLSEHPVSEDRLGRLSMWRAYGGKAGVALVLNSEIVFDTGNTTDVIKAYSAPILYRASDDFEHIFNEWVDSVMGSENLLTSVGPDVFVNCTFLALRTFMLSTKHPGFHEELEWRVFHTPELDGASPLRMEIESIAGVPQPVMKLNLQEYPGEDRLSIPKLLHRIIIGPTDYPQVIFDALAATLKSSGVENPGERIWASRIPLRNQP